MPANSVFLPTHLLPRCRVGTARLTVAAGMLGGWLVLLAGCATVERPAKPTSTERIIPSRSQPVDATGEMRLVGISKEGWVTIEAPPGRRLCARHVGDTFANRETESFYVLREIDLRADRAVVEGLVFAP